ncbi:hypothetical protein [Porticoccus sp.]|uniref:hypothetical protein n=1 Tax=Porticoccus sp. TaxID=2024853 RepID=UPI003F6A27C8
MKAQKKIPFEYIDESRQSAGFFVRDVCTHLGITERSYYRWKASGYGPKWVYKGLQILSGKLDFFGWKGWYICNGELYRDDFNPKYYNKTPGELAADWYMSAQPAIKSRLKRNKEDPMLVYKVVSATKGFKELEKEVSLLLNKGWKPVGGVAFNNGYAYQAMVGKPVTDNKKVEQPDPDTTTLPRGAVDAMKKIDSLT